MNWTWSRTIFDFFELNRQRSRFLILLSIFFFVGLKAAEALKLDERSNNFFLQFFIGSNLFKKRTKKWTTAHNKIRVIRSASSCCSIRGTKRERDNKRTKWNKRRMELFKFYLKYLFFNSFHSSVRFCQFLLIKLKKETFFNVFVVREWKKSKQFKWKQLNWMRDGMNCLIVELRRHF